jgi:hypothetical protein
MTIDRRGLLLGGGVSAAAAQFAGTAQAAASAGGKTLADFGIQSSDNDQTETLQRAINELAGAKKPVIFPAGVYTAASLEIPSLATLIGVPGLTVLRTGELRVKYPVGSLAGLITLSGLIVMQERAPESDALLASAAAVDISHCVFSGVGERAIRLRNLPASFNAVTFTGWSGAAILSGSANLSVNGCHFEACGTGIATEDTSVSSLVNNRFDQCGTAAALRGTAMASANIVTTAKDFGLKLGSAKGSGHIIAQGNLLRDCRIAIGVSASGDDIMASLNMIAGAKEGAIRAFDGDKLVGPDLARQSAEAYLNLMVAGNVVR